jgi:hypothetical protein
LQTFNQGNVTLAAQNDVGMLKSGVGQPQYDGGTTYAVTASRGDAA